MRILRTNDSYAFTCRSSHQGAAMRLNALNHGLSFTLLFIQYPKSQFISQLALGQDHVMYYKKFYYAHLILYPVPCLVPYLVPYSLLCLVYCLEPRPIPYFSAQKNMIKVHFIALCRRISAFITLVSPCILRRSILTTNRQSLSHGSGRARNSKISRMKSFI